MADVAVGTFTGDLRDAVVADPEYSRTDLIRLIRHNVQTRHFVALVHHSDDFFRYILEDDRIECLFPAVQKTCADEHQGIERKNIVPCRPVQADGKIDCDKVSAAAGTIALKRKTGRKAADQAAEYRDQKRILCDHRKIDDTSQK